MSSSYGAKHGLPGFDEFRTGLTYQDVFNMLRDESDNPQEWKYKSRGVILGKWHQLKLELYERACENGYTLNKIQVATNARNRRLGKMSRVQKAVLAKRSGRRRDLRRV